MEWGRGACTCALLTHLTIVGQVKRKYYQNKQCATISQHVDILIVNESHVTREYLMTMQITHKHKLFSFTSSFIASASCAFHGMHVWSFYVYIHVHCCSSAFLVISSVAFDIVRSTLLLW
jgi:hypothetical protein